MSEHTIKDTSSLLALVSDVRQRHPELRLVFRGQRHDFEPAPSAQRKLGDHTQAILQSSWVNLSNHLLHESSEGIKPTDLVLMTMAILQHYGFRSWFLDVASDPLVGAWFACHDCVADRILVQPKPVHSGPMPSPYLCDHAFAVASVARYEKGTTNGHFMIYGIAEESSNAFFLNGLAHIGALRVLRQAAGLLIPPLDGTTMSDLLLEKVQISPSIDLPSDLSTRWLFPGVCEDAIYRKLLSIPRVAFDVSTHPCHRLPRYRRAHVPLRRYA